MMAEGDDDTESTGADIYLQGLCMGRRGRGQGIRQAAGLRWSGMADRRNTTQTKTVVEY